MVPINTTNATSTTSTTSRDARVARALSAKDTSVRLQAAMAVGSNPDPDLLETLIERCAVEPDFFVRDMLTWALIRLPTEITLPRICRELDSERTQARGQALHLLSKIGDKGTWAWITRDMLHDANDQVARTAWRVAVMLVPENEKKDLVGELVKQLGRGDRGVRLSLSRALVDLGDVAEPALEAAARNADPAVAAHARATEMLRQDPETGFDAAVDEAERVDRLGPERAAAAAAAVAAVDTGSTDAGEPTESAELADTTEPAEPAELADTTEPTEPAEPAEGAGPTAAAGSTDAAEAAHC